MKIINRKANGQFKSQNNPILTGAFVILFGAIVVAGLWYSLQESDRVYCYKLQSQSVEFKDKGFYITELDKKICDELSIIVNAPVHGAQIEQAR